MPVKLIAVAVQRNDQAEDLVLIAMVDAKMPPTEYHRRVYSALLRHAAQREYEDGFTWAQIGDVSATAWADAGLMQAAVVPAITMAGDAVLVPGEEKVLPPPPKVAPRPRAAVSDFQRSLEAEPPEAPPA